MDKTNTIAVFGSTGSIGVQTLDVASRLNLGVSVLTANNNSVLLEKQCRKYKPRSCLISEEKYADMKTRLADTDIHVYTGASALEELAYTCECDIFYNSLMGVCGLRPTLAALDGGKKRIALSNKETLVAGGTLVMEKARKNGAQILPVDSEHSAIFQCLHAGGKPKRILLTASGGPFFGKKRSELENIKPADALKHPNWSMGSKITVDSSTMMNKGLEVIEAVFLFDVLPEQIKVIIHRESVIHSMVEFPDGAVIAQLGSPDMRLCIQYAATYPERLASDVKQLDFDTIQALSFSAPDNKTFPLLELAYSAIKKGGNVPAAMNAANETAVALFLGGKIKYTDIFERVANAVESCTYIENPTLEDIEATTKIAASL